MSFPEPTNVTGLLPLFQHANNLVDGMLGMFIVIIVFFLTFISNKQYTWERAFAFSSFITFIVALFLRFMNMINDVVFFTVIALLIIAIVLLWWEH
jgi:hypothetical protein